MNENIEKYNYSFGGQLADIPGPIRRRWPNSTTPRDVNVKITTWVGHDNNAEHYTLTIEEEFNLILNEEKHVWQNAHDDYKGIGFSCEIKFLNFIYAKNIAKAIIKEMFSGPGHKVTWEYPDEAATVITNKLIVPGTSYRPPREGD